MQENSGIWFQKISYWSLNIFILSPLCAYILKEIFNIFQKSQTSFSLDTLYLNWNTSFPAVTVCEIYNGEKNWDVSEDHFGVDRDRRIDDLIGEITFFRGKCETCLKCVHDNLTCPNDIYHLISLFRTPCTNLFANCSWIDEPIDCCDNFKPILTEFGLCYSFNSVQARKLPEIPFINNRETGPGKLTISANEDIQVHLHASVDVPFLNNEGSIYETVLWGSVKEIVFSVMDIYNDPTIMDLSPEARQCKFYNEIEVKDTNLYPYYSFSNCIIECSQTTQILTCGCHFIMDSGFGTSSNNSLICGIEGLICLTENFAIFQEIRRDCDCLPSCDEPEFNLVLASLEEPNKESEESKIIVRMIHLPTQRYIRYLQRNNLDVMIMLGGILSLFYGLSVLNVIHLLYTIYNAFRKISTTIIKKISNINIFFKSVNSDKAKKNEVKFFKVRQILKKLSPLK